MGKKDKYVEKVKMDLATNGGFVRLVHDTYWGDVRDLANRRMRVIPETVTFSDYARGKKKGHPIQLTITMKKFLASINTPKSVHWALAPGAAWVNKRDGKACEAIGFGGNVVKVKTIEGDFGRLEAFPYSSYPPDFGYETNYAQTPWLIQKITCIRRKDGAILNPGKGLDIYIPLIKRTELWVNLGTKVESFPGLPFKATIQVDGLNVRAQARKTPDNILRSLTDGDEVVFYEYYPRGSNVWARISSPGASQEWITIQSGWNYYTTWTMKTIAPVPPK